jgi:hypothetical protein
LRSAELPLAALTLALLVGAALLIWQGDVDANQRALDAVLAGAPAPTPPAAVSGGTLTAQERW